MIWRACLAICGLAVGAALAAGDDEKPALKFLSPDGRCALRIRADVGKAEVVEISSQRMVADISEEPMDPEAMNLVWAPDSQSFAANFRAGGRYDATAFFRWNGEKFADLDWPEEKVYERAIDPAKKRELKAAHMPEDTPLRRIWDSWETVKWVDASTAEVLGEFTSAYATDDDMRDIAISVRATVRFEKESAPEIVKVEEVPAKD